VDNIENKKRTVTGNCVSCGGQSSIVLNYSVFFAYVEVKRNGKYAALRDVNERQGFENCLYIGK
jgi:hypothetical protein